MKDNQDSNRDDLLERATRAVRQTPVPDGPPSDTLPTLVARLEESANRRRSLTFIERILAMKPLTKISTAAASLFVLAGAFTWLFVVGGGASLALADVAKVLDDIHSVTSTITVTQEDESATKEGEPPVTLKAMYLEPARYRTESSRGMVMIYGEFKMVTLVPERKFAAVINLKDTPAKVGGEDFGTHWLQSVRQEIRDAIGGSNNDVKELGQRQIDGRQAVGFRLRVNNREMTVWADPETALPIRVERTSGLMKPRYHHVMSDFQYNVELDESLFSLEPPDGYLVQETSVDASTSQEEDLVQLLRVYAAEREDGMFPPTLSGSEIEAGVSPIVQRRIDAKFGEDWRDHDELRKQVLRSEEFKDFMSLHEKLGRGIGFLRDLPPEVDWRYAGKDVELDTPDRPVFWYKPTDNQNYRVIYADLSVGEVAAGDLDGFPEASGPE